jgi:uncharacterized lipoprotein YddW (UPF0748 family)
MMISRRLKPLPIAAVIALVSACSGERDITGPPPVTPEDTTAPPVRREMRGLWIATVANIDWPSARTLTADQQRAELSDIIARAAAAGINTIVLQVRPAGDAVYQSSLEPWALLLSGTQGTNPGYDPLAFAIQEAHARGMELHAWINPFRAGNTVDTAKMVAPHLYKTRPDLIRVYGGNIWMDPGEPDVREHSMRVVTDIVTRYDIDGIHADDYFYPYVVNDAVGQPIPFPDESTYSRYGAGLQRDDWRRANIDAFVERMYREVHAIKPTIKVGISPFGIWRPGNPPGVAGLDAYATIYADSRKWLQQGWVDYLAPQLYWAISAPQQSYPALLDWWLGQNAAGRHVWPGLAAYRVSDGTSSAFTIQEIPDQIRTTRARAGAGGNLLYNTTATLKRNSGALATVLAQDLYRNAALVPAVPWLDSAPPPTPSIALSGNMLALTPAAGESVRWWAVRLHSPGAWTFRVLFGAERSLDVATTVDRILVQAADQAGNLSPSAEWRR